jgi:hypothetical protein
MTKAEVIEAIIAYERALGGPAGPLFRRSLTRKLKGELLYSLDKYKEVAALRGVRV